MDIQEEIGKKGFDVEKIASFAIENPDCIKQLIEGVSAPKGSIRLVYEAENFLKNKQINIIADQR